MLGTSSTARAAARAALFSTWLEAGSGLFDDCYLDHQGSFAVRHYRSLPDVTPEGIDFFPTPSIGTADTASLQEVSDDVAAMFRDTAPARALMAYLASDETQRIWHAASAGLYFNRRGPVGVGSDPIIDKMTARLSTATLCRDGSDLMPTAVESTATPGVAPAANSAALAQFQSMPHRPDEIEIKFGVQLTADAHAVIARTGVQGQFEVTVRWQRASDG